MSAPSAEPLQGDGLIGRSREIETFRAALDAVNRAVASVVQVTGEPGIGRTSLLRAFERLAAEQGAVCLLSGAGEEEERPLGPLLPAAAHRGLPCLAEALAAPEFHPELFENLVAALASDAAADPVWLLVDDLDMADEATRSFCETLLAAVYHGRLRDRRIGLVLSLRAGTETAPLRERLDLHDRHGAGRRITLERFTSHEVQQWLDTTFAVAADAELAALLARSSGGNPLLLSELVGFMRQRGLLRQSRGRLTLAPGAAGTVLPDSIAGVIASRLESVSAPCRRALTLAASIGTRFDSASLAELSGQPIEQVAALADEGVRAGLLERGRGGTLAFRSAVTRSHLYATADRRLREANHLQVCEGLIGELGDGADEHALTITHHLLRAGALADRTLILRYAPPAAELAFRHHSYYLAGRYFQAAAEAAEADGADEAGALAANLYTRAGEAFQRWSEGDRSVRCFTRAVTLFEALDDVSGHARALHGLLRSLIAFGESGDRAADVAVRLQGLLSALPEADVELRVRAHDTLAAYRHYSGRFDAAEACAQTAMTIARSGRDPTLRCVPVTSLALAQMEQLRLADAKATWLEGLSYDRAAGARRYEGLHLQRLPLLLYGMGELGEAERYNHASYRHNQAIGNTGELSLNLGVDLMIANLRGDFDTAIGAGREAMRLMSVTRYLWNAPSVIAGLAYALTMTLRFDEAESVVAHLAADGLTYRNTTPYRATAARLARLIALHRDADAAAEPGPAGVTTPPRGVRLASLGRLCCEAELALLERRPERLSGTHDTLEFVHRRGATLGFGWCTSVPRALAISTAMRRGMDRAEATFAEAARLAERCQAPLELARVQLSRGLAALAGGDAEASTAHQALRDALECFDELGAPALARIAEAAMTRTTAHPGTR